VQPAQRKTLKLANKASQIDRSLFSRAAKDFGIAKATQMSGLGSRSENFWNFEQGNFN
jgi:hypothetical protein